MNVKVISLLVIIIALVKSNNVENIDDIEGEKANFEFSTDEMTTSSESNTNSSSVKSNAESSFEMFNNSYDEIFLNSISVNSNENESDFEIPEDQSQVDMNIHSSSNQDSKTNIAKTVIANEEYEEEDQVAKYAFFIILVILLIFMGAFVYNLVKCYLKAPNKEDFGESENNTNTNNVNNLYSRELGNINDDSIIDLSN